MSLSSDIDTTDRPRRDSNDFFATPLASLLQPSDTYFLSDDVQRASSLPRPNANGFRAKVLSKPNRPISISQRDEMSDLASTLSSPSTRDEFEYGSDGIMSHAPMSSEEDEEPVVARTDLPELLVPSSAMFVMPTIPMPSRKPFTAKGKTLGRFKVLVAGAKGSGKTSLIRAISQTCRDIVYIDESPPLSSISSVTHKKEKLGTRGACAPSATDSVDEYRASTRAYPAWWSDIEESRILKRKKSGAEPILERNICFIDTPGYAQDDMFIASVRPVLRYMEEQLAASSTLNMRDEDIINMMSGDGGSQVDVVLYLIDQELQPLDITYLKMLTALASVIPVLVKAEDLTPQQIQNQRLLVLMKLAEATIEPFLFRNTLEQALLSPSISPPYAISTKDGNDHEIMDASLLMSPEYVSPLVPSQLSDLVEQVFDADTISWLRHLTAKKYVHSHLNKTAARSKSFPSSARPPSLISNNLSITNSFGTSSASAFTNAKLADQAFREERLAQIELSKWSTNLQRTIQNERMHYENLARGERAEWLIQRMNETIQQGQIVPRQLLSEIDDTSHDSKSVLDCTGRTTKSAGRSKRPGGLPKMPASAWAKTAVGSSDNDDFAHLHAQMWKRTLAILGGFGVFGGLVWFIGNGALRAVASWAPWEGSGA